MFKANKERQNYVSVVFGDMKNDRTTSLLLSKIDFQYGLYFNSPYVPRQTT